MFHIFSMIPWYSHDIPMILPWYSHHLSIFMGLSTINHQWLIFQRSNPKIWRFPSIFCIFLDGIPSSHPYFYGIFPSTIQLWGRPFKRLRGAMVPPWDPGWSWQGLGPRLAGRNGEPAAYPGHSIWETMGRSMENDRKTIGKWSKS